MFSKDFNIYEDLLNKCVTDKIESLFYNKRTLLKYKLRNGSLDSDAICSIFRGLVINTLTGLNANNTLESISIGTIKESLGQYIDVIMKYFPKVQIILGATRVANIYFIEHTRTEAIMKDQCFYTKLYYPWDLNNLNNYNVIYINMLSFHSYEKYKTASLVGALIDLPKNSKITKINYLSK